MKKQNRKQRNIRTANSGNGANYQTLEPRKMFATLNATNVAILDFDGEWMNDSQLQRGQWSTDDFNDTGSAVSFSSFNSLFTNSRPFLDFDGNGNVNSADSQIAIDKVVDKVMEDYSPYDIDFIVGDQDTYSGRMTDDVFGDVTVIITGSPENTIYGTSWGHARLDEGNTTDGYAFVYAGGSVDSSVFENGEQWLNQIARTVSHEMGHTFGLEHKIGSTAKNAESMTHSIMGSVDRDWTRDFSFHDIAYLADEVIELNGASLPVYQNDHSVLSTKSVLGPSDSSWMAILKPGQLTINTIGNGAQVADNITIDTAPNDGISITVNGMESVMSIDSRDVDSFNPFAKDLSQIRAYTGAGNDVIEMRWNMLMQLNAWTGAGNDLVYAGASSDNLNGGSGNDILYGRNGKDVINGGSGADKLYGGAYADTLIGGSGNDILVGSSGDDYLFGGSGYDKLYGQSGSDYLDGGMDGIADYLSGGDGADDFRREMYRSWWSWFNRENAVDFNTSEGDQWVG